MKCIEENCGVLLLLFFKKAVVCYGAFPAVPTNSTACMLLCLQPQPSFCIVIFCSSLLGFFFLFQIAPQLDPAPTPLLLPWKGHL